MVILSVALLALNDQMLKSATWFPDVLSGKASDVLGLFSLPIVTVAIAEIVTRRVLPWGYTAAASCLISALFAMSKFDTAAADMVEQLATMLLIPLRLLVGADTSREVHFVRDLTDLITLVGAIAAPAFVRSRDRLLGEH